MTEILGRGNKVYPALSQKIALIESSSDPCSLPPEGETTNVLIIPS